MKKRFCFLLAALGTAAMTVRHTAAAQSVGRREAASHRTPPSHPAPLSQGTSDPTETFAPVQARLQRTCPDDPGLREKRLANEVRAYRFLRAVPASDLKRRVQRACPASYALQKMPYQDIGQNSAF